MSLPVFRSLISALIAFYFPLHFVHDLQTLLQLRMVEVFALFSRDSLSVILLELGARAIFVIRTNWLVLLSRQEPGLIVRILHLILLPFLDAR